MLLRNAIANLSEKSIDIVKRSLDKGEVPPEAKFETVQAMVDVAKNY